MLQAKKLIVDGMMSETPPTTPKSLIRENSTPLKSILRTPSTPKSSGGVHFGPPIDLEQTLLKAASDEPLYRNELEGFITHMKNQKGHALVEWMQKIQENLALLKPSLESFVLAILNIPWADQERPVVNAYKHFLTNLISAQSYYTKPVVKMLLSAMLGSRDQQENTEEAFENVHEALRSVIRVSPLAANNAILYYGKNCMPFMVTPLTHTHTNYIRNMLKMTEYFPEERIAILTLIIDRLVQLDANLPIGEDLYEDDDDNEEDEKESEETEEKSADNPPAKKSREQICRDNLDEAMAVLFDFIKKKHDSSESDLKSLYEDILRVFETNILPSYATGHVQFVIFYLASLRPKYFPIRFIDYLWKQFVSPSCPSILRQVSIAYIASLIARAKFIDVTQLRLYLKKITTWIQSYLSARVDNGSDYNYVNVRAHGPFYAASQALLYMLAFRYEELVQGPKSIGFLANLGLSKLVTCSLNPLKVCLPPVVKNFAAIARHYQLAYCETVIQKNNRLNLPVVGSMSSTSSVIGDAKPALLDTFFPFDPYRLKESRKFILEHYREYQGSIADEDEDDDSDSSDSEDEVEDNLATPKPKRRRLNSSGSLTGLLMDYEASPGFMKIESM